MRTRGQLRYSILLPLGLSGTAVILGAGIAVLSEGTGFRVLAIAFAMILAVVLAASATPAALVKVRNLAADCRWWHWLWLLIFLSGLVFRARDIDMIREGPLDFWAGWRIGLVGIVAVVLVSRLASRTSNWGANLLRGLPAGIFLFGLTSLVSTLWSIYPLWTLYKSVEYLVDVALLAAIVSAVRTADEIKTLFDLTWLLTGILLLTVWLGVLLRPDVAVMRVVPPIGIEIQGVLPSISSNGVGELAGILVLIAGTRLLSRSHHRGFYWVVCLTALPTLVLAQSRSAVTAALLGLLAVLVLNRRFGLLAVIGVAGAVLISLTSAATVAQEAFLRGQNAEMFRSLSGRVNWWIPAWEAFRENPFLGLGGYAAGRFGVLSSLGVSQTSSLHNAWLEILVGVGLAGLLPFLITFFGTCLNLLRPLYTRSATSVPELRFEAIGIFVLICFRSIFTVEFIWHPPLLFFLTLAYAELLRTSRLENISATRSGPAARTPGLDIRSQRAFASRKRPLRGAVRVP